MAVVVDCTQNDEEPDHAVGIVAGEGKWIVVGRGSPWRMEWPSNYVYHQTDVSKAQHGPCEDGHGCGLYCDSCIDDEDSMMHHLRCYGWGACEDAGESQHDRLPVVASCVHDGSSPEA